MIVHAAQQVHEEATKPRRSGPLGTYETRASVQGSRQPPNYKVFEKDRVCYDKGVQKYQIIVVHQMVYALLVEVLFAFVDKD